MKLRSSLLLVAPIAAMAAVSAHAAVPAKAPKPLVITDDTGDANLISDQGFISNTPIPSGTKTDPASAAQFDIKSLTVAATGGMATKKVGRKTVKFFNCTGYTVTMELAGAPLAQGTLYRVQASTPLHPTYWLEWSNEASGASQTTLRYTDEAATLGTTSIPIAAAKVVGTKIVFTVTSGNIKASGEKLGKAILSGFGADVRNNLKAQGTGATVPMWDQLKTDGSQAWKVCPV